MQKTKQISLTKFNFGNEITGRKSLTKLNFVNEIIYLFYTQNLLSYYIDSIPKRKFLK